jgi:hypothetical protein
MKHFSIALIWASAVTAMSVRCLLPISYAWTDSGPLAYSELAVPVDSGIHGTSLDDLTHVSYRGRHLVYASFTQGHQAGSVAFGTFSEWSEMASATQTQMQDTLTTIAPTLFYLRPKDIWVLAYQGGGSSVSASSSTSQVTFSYMLSTTPDDPNAWYGARPLFAGRIPNQVFGHPTPIGDSMRMYLFFTNKQGTIFRSSMPMGDFPGEFGSWTEVVIGGEFDFRRNLDLIASGGVQIYTVKNDGNKDEEKDQYLMIIEAQGDEGRYLASFTATRLDGSWTPQAASELNPFAGKANSGASWTDDIRRGALIRSDPDQTFTIDACNVQVLYRGWSPLFYPGYMNYRPGVLTLNTTIVTVTAAASTASATAPPYAIVSPTRTSITTVSISSSRPARTAIATRTKTAIKFITETITKKITKTKTTAKTKVTTKMGTATKTITKTIFRKTAKLAPATITVWTTPTLTVELNMNLTLNTSP